MSRYTNTTYAILEREVMSAENPLLRKFIFGVFIRRQLHSSDPIAVASAQKLLADQQLYDDTFDALEADALVGTPLTDLLQWLLDNGPAILALIAQIIAMFSASNSSQAV